MPGLALAWRYLTGHAVATDVSSRDRPEWPPHPARVFMALAAAWFETEPDAGPSEAREQWEAEGEALRWIEGLGDPVLLAPPADRNPRTTVTVFVPVNDDDAVRKPSTAPIQSAPAVTRSRQPRTFPQVWVGDDPCFLQWPEVDADAFERHRPALERLCAKVTRIGHSSSLVQMWVSGEPVPDKQSVAAWEPTELSNDLHVRPVSNGLLAMLEERFGEAARRRAAALDEQIVSLQAEARKIRGKGAGARKQEIRDRIRQLEQERAAVPARPPMRPTIGVWRGYVRNAPGATGTRAVRGVFDSDMLVLALSDGPALPAAATLLATAALRNAILRRVHDHLCGCSGWKQGPPAEASRCWSRIPAWVSGHESDGKPLTGGEHMAIVALPFVGRRHADGHLLGLALVFPRAVTRDERGRVLGPVLLEDNGSPRRLELVLGRPGVVHAELRDPDDVRSTLLAETWTALEGDGTEPSGSRLWASATPVVLDRFPKADRCGEPAEWRAEVARLIASSCERVGLPAPAAVETGTTSWLRGCPRAFFKRRPLRTSREGCDHEGALLGDGFPFLVAGSGGAPRPQVHARVVFPVPVVGPVLLGAGRFRGYGLFRPVREEGP
ncbi:MAG: hypothetical protein Kow0062_19560 [Acidobacteriota bacterium]